MKVNQALLSNSSREQLSTAKIDKYYPLLSTEILGWRELQFDEYYSFLPKEHIKHYIEKSIDIGRHHAQSYKQFSTLQEWMNLLLKNHIQVRFLEESTNHCIRAQYICKTKTIEVYRTSINQIRSFLDTINSPIREEDLVLLHVAHEFFHHLEETKIKRTDLQLPKVVVKQLGPLIWKKPIIRTREIAAHTFTQEILGISWSPMNLDFLIEELERGTSKPDLRQKSIDYRKQYEDLVKENNHS